MGKMSVRERLLSRARLAGVMLLAAAASTRSASWEIANTRQRYVDGHFKLTKKKGGADYSRFVGTRSVNGLLWQR